MPAKFGTKNCLECNKLIECKIQRDVLRKKFCSKTCHGTYTVKNRPPEMAIKNFNHLADNSKKAHHGENHPLYKHDRSKLRSKRPPYETKQWRNAVFERDNYTCQECKQRGGRLQADHIKPWATHPESRFDINNGRTLCKKCHSKTETYGIKFANKLRKDGFYAKSK